MGPQLYKLRMLQNDIDFSADAAIRYKLYEVSL